MIRRAIDRNRVLDCLPYACSCYHLLHYLQYPQITSANLYEALKFFCFRDSLATPAHFLMAMKTPSLKLYSVKQSAGYCSSQVDFQPFFFIGGCGKESLCLVVFSLDVPMSSAISSSFVLILSSAAHCWGSQMFVRNGCVVKVSVKQLS